MMVKQTHDQHFTDRQEAAQIVSILLHRIDPWGARRYIEPSCGEGAFVDALRDSGIHRKRIRTVDIDRKMPADVHGDFLKSSRESLGIGRWKREHTVVIGNPPFGRGGKLAKDFLNKAIEYADLICFVLPRSMQAQRNCGTLNKRLELCFERQIHGGFETTKAKCNWQEWCVLPEGWTGSRPIEIEADTRNLYQIVEVGQPHKLIIQRCGGSAGRVAKCNGSGEGKYYINSRYREVVEAFKHLPKDIREDFTTHQKSLSTALLHEMLEKALLEQYITSIVGDK